MYIHPLLACVPGPPGPGVVDPLVLAVAAPSLGLPRRLKPVRSGVTMCWRLSCKASSTWSRFMIRIKIKIRILSKSMVIRYGDPHLPLSVRVEVDVGVGVIPGPLGVLEVSLVTVPLVSWSQGVKHEFL